MDLLMNGLLIAATLFAGGYCWVLGRRVQDLKSLDRGLGGSIVTLTRQIELARTTLDEARGASQETRADLDRLIGKAEAAANQLRLLIAAAPAAPPPAPEPVRSPAPPPGPPPAPEPVRAPLAAVPVAGERGVEVGFAVADLMALARPPEVAAEAPAVAMNLAEVPKPRALVPVENPLRRAKGAAAKPGAAADAVGEEAILEALSALAAGGR